MTKLPTTKSIPTTHLRVLVLPTISSTPSFHPHFLKPQSPLERSLLVTAYLTRQLRFRFSDLFASRWHTYGRECQQLGDDKFYWTVNRKLLHGRKCVDEYFLKSIPTRTKSIEFYFPELVNGGKDGIKKEDIKRSLEQFLSDSPKHLRSMTLYALTFPVTLYLTKYMYIFSLTPFFVYQCFRIMSHFRAHLGAEALKRCFERRTVEFIPDAKVNEVMEESVEELKKDSESALGNWKWYGNNDAFRGDIHDEVLMKMEKKLKVPELLRGYRRSRWEVILHHLNLGTSSKVDSGKVAERKEQ